MNLETRSAMLKKVMEADFAAYDLVLYLDTHPEDTAAMEMYNQLVKKAKEARDAYEAAYGPLTVGAAAGQKEWTWIKSPWPWD